GGMATNDQASGHVENVGSALWEETCRYLFGYTTEIGSRTNDTFRADAQAIVQSIYESSAPMVRCNVKGYEGDAINNGWGNGSFEMRSLNWIWEGCNSKTRRERSTTWAS
ncbi:MAG: hypothetical protein ACKEQK_00700, partial [Candidatus Hodgkinia cicadicola]